MTPSGAERCRYCDRPLNPADPQHRCHWPFCCARCRMAELGRWFDERYVVSRPIDQVADDAGGSPKPPPNPSAGQDASDINT